MNDVLLIFRSRSQAMDCVSKLKRMGVQARLMNTPKEANVGCGLSVAVPKAQLSLARRILSQQRYSAFFGVFTPKFGGWKG